jgi:hypothetical protein
MAIAVTTIEMPCCGGLADFTLTAVGMPEPREALRLSCPHCGEPLTLWLVSSSLIGRN